MKRFTSRALGVRSDIHPDEELIRFADHLADLDAMMAKTVWAMELIQEEWLPGTQEFSKAAAFLTRPDVVAWRKEQKP